MNTFLAALTIVTIAICGPKNITLNEDLSVVKFAYSTATSEIAYKKVPTKWVKITKKSN